MKYLNLIMLIPLAKLVMDDFRRREVSLIWLAVTAVCAIGTAIVVDGWRETLIRSGLNLLLVVYMGIGVVVWAWIKSRKIVNPINRHIGSGDVLFFLTLTPLFSLKGFAWLLVACMVFSLFWWKSPENIPLVATSGIVTGLGIITSTILR